MTGENERQQVAYHLAAMLDSDRVLYERCLDTIGFAYHFNQICVLAQGVASPLIESAAYRRGLERALELVEGEYLTDSTGTDDDAAYQQAITDALNAIRAEIAAHTEAP